MNPNTAQVLIEEELPYLEPTYGPDFIEAIKTALIILIAFNNTLKEVSK